MKEEKETVQSTVRYIQAILEGREIRPKDVLLCVNKILKFVVDKLDGQKDAPDLGGAHLAVLVNYAITMQEMTQGQVQCVPYTKDEQMINFEKDSFAKAPKTVH